jgi:hypothetical protein
MLVVMIFLKKITARLWGARVCARRFSSDLLCDALILFEYKKISNNATNENDAWKY